MSKTAGSATNGIPNLKRLYRERGVAKLQKEFGYKNVMQVPRLVKVVLNIGIGEATQNAKLLDQGSYTLSVVSGQKPVITRAKKSISNFKLREGVPIGCMVTLRGNRMFEFLERLVSVALPRVRDFKGVSGKSFDGRGNYTFGIQEQLIFPEIDYDKVEKVQGMNITIVTSAPTDAEAKILLKVIGIPFRN